MARKMLGEILLEEHCIDEETLKKALEKQKQYALTDRTDTHALPIPYVVQPDWKIALFFKLGILPVMLYALAKMARMQTIGTLQENFGTLIAILITFIFIDLLVIRHTYVQKVVLYNDKFVYKGKHTVMYKDITKVETGMHIGFTQIGYRAKVFTNGNEEPLLVNISMFDNTDLKVMYSILDNQTKNAEFNEYSAAIKDGKFKMVENDILKWVSLFAGAAVLVFLLVGLSNVMFR